MLVRKLNQNEPLAAAWEHSHAPPTGEKTTACIMPSSTNGECRTPVAAKEHQTPAPLAGSLAPGALLDQRQGAFFLAAAGDNG